MLPFLIPAITSLGSFIAGKRGSRGSKQPSQSGATDINALMAQFPQLRRALDMQTQQSELRNTQMQRQDPLHAALTQLGMKLASEPFNPRQAAANMPQPEQNVHRLPTRAR